MWPINATKPIAMLKRFGSSPLVRNVLAVASGTVAAQVIVFAFSPLITRIYSPEVFGLQGVFLSLISVFSPVIALRYPMAIIIAETETGAIRLALLSLLIALSTASLLWLILFAGGQTLLQLLGAEGLGSLILFLPLALICIAMQDVADYYAARLGAFRVVGLVEIAQAFMVNFARVTVGLVAPVAATLISITAIGPALKAVLIRVATQEQRCPLPSPSRVETRELLKKHRDFPLYRMPTDVLNALSQSVPVLLLASLFSPAAAGLYALTRSVLNLPSNIIGVAIGNVLYVRFAELSRQGQPLMPLLLRCTGGLLALAPIIIGLAWFAPSVFALAFGEEWREAGYYAQWMALWTGLSLSNIPAIRLAPVIGGQQLLLIANIAILAARTAGMYGTAWSTGDARLAVAIFSIISLISNTLLTLFLILQCSRYEKHLIRY